MQALEANFLLRITPACAGKTKELAELEESNKDHPRVCGENYLGRLHSLLI